MEMTSSVEATSCVSSQIPSISCNPKIHYNVHKIPPLDSVLSQINPDPTTPSYVSNFEYGLGILNQVQVVVCLRIISAVERVQYVSDRKACIVLSGH
jgi:hypothetical protein